MAGVREIIQRSPHIRAAMPHPTAHHKYAQWAAAAQLLLASLPQQPGMVPLQQRDVQVFLSNQREHLQDLSTQLPHRALTVAAVQQVVQERPQLKGYLPCVGQPFRYGHRQQLASGLAEFFPRYSRAQILGFLHHHVLQLGVSVAAPAPTSSSDGPDPNLAEIAELMQIAASDDPEAQKRLDAWQERDRTTLLETVTKAVEAKVRKQTVKILKINYNCAVTNHTSLLFSRTGRRSIHTKLWCTAG